MCHHNSWTDLPQIYTIYIQVGQLIQGIIIYDQALVNGVSNYEYPGQRWVLKLVYK